MRLLVAAALSLSIWSASVSALAQYSYEQAKADLYRHSPALQAAALLDEASRIQADALSGLGRPTISLNARAISYHQRADVATDGIKSALGEHLNTQSDAKLTDLANLGLDTDQLSQIGQINQQLIGNAINRLPNEIHLDAKDSQITPSIVISAPLYTGGVISTSKQIANLGSQRQSLSTQEQNSLVQLELIRLYFGTQLKHTLSQAAASNYQAMQQHANNALKLEQAGFISRGQRMQFEVARNQTQRAYELAKLAYEQSLFELQDLLGKRQLDELSTLLFINPSQSLSWQDLQQAFDTQSPLVQKLAADVSLANQQVKLQKASKKPKVFAFGEYAPSDNDWFVGVAANYPLYTGVNRDGQIQAARLKANAAAAAAEQATQQAVKAMHLAYLEFNNARLTHGILVQNRSAALENLRIQKLAFQEGFGTATDVIDAENRLQQVHSETAANAYRYIMALASLLHSTGNLDRFGDYLTGRGVIQIAN
ncbi:TolC family protein [Moraxella sp. ZJ142]|uniref:TolC family protein n=1 Tax=Moraxella marmotae TaxID=3344520 RepID=UPI0035D431F2